MSCLLIVSWVIEVEYTLTAIPQLGKKKDKKLVLTFFSGYSEFTLLVQKKEEKAASLCNLLLFIEKGGLIFIL